MSMIHHHHRTSSSGRFTHNRTTSDEVPERAVMDAGRPSPHEVPGDDLTLTDHDIAAQLPPEVTGITSDGKMESHRTPIVSIHGKDVDERVDPRHSAA